MKWIRPMLYTTALILMAYLKVSWLLVLLGVLVILVGGVVFAQPKEFLVQTRHYTRPFLAFDFSLDCALIVCLVYVGMNNTAAIWSLASVISLTAGLKIIATREAAA